jgi:hypothetical protein
MGWLSACRPACLDHNHMIRAFRLSLYLVLGLFFGAYAAVSHAAYTSVQGGAIAANGAWSGGGTYSGGTVTTQGTVPVGGTSGTVTITGTLTAAVVGAAVIGGWPGAAIGSAIYTYLTSQGWQFDPVKGWTKSGPSVPQTLVDSSTSAMNCGLTEGTTAFNMFAGGTKWYRTSCSPDGSYPPPFPGAQLYRYCSTDSTYTIGCNPYSGALWHKTESPPPCPTDYTLRDGACWPDNYVPVGETDWEAIRNAPKSDDVVKGICSQLAAMGSTSVGCTAQNVKIPGVTTVPLSDWKSSGNGTKTRDVAKITPAPTAGDPLRVEVTTETETVTTTDTAPTSPPVVSTTNNPDGSTTTTSTQTNPDGTTTTTKTTSKTAPDGTVTTTTTNPDGTTTTTTQRPDGSTQTQTSESTPKENEDFCILNPDALACWKAGEPENPDVPVDTKNISITPQSGWGLDTASCPAPRSHTLVTGQTIVMSWEPVCDGAAMFRPVVIGLAWLSALYAFLAIQRKSQA